MRREVVYRGMDAAPKRVSDALERATLRIEKQVSRFDPRSAFLRVVVAGHPTRTRHSVSIRLTLRGGVLHAREESTDAVTALRASFKQLREQLSRHISQFRREHLRDKVSHPAVVLAEDLAEQAAHEMRVLQPLDAEQISRLQRFVRRELFYRRLDGRLPYGISAASVVDETVVLALEEADEKPAWLSYDAWLLRLARRALDARTVSWRVSSNGARDPHVEWEAVDAGLLDPPSEDDWLSYFQPDDEASVGDVTEDRRIVSPADHLAQRELQSHVHRILGELPQAWRHAFTLCTIEGFAPSDAASSLESSSDEVQRQVALATEFLRAKLRDTGYRSLPVAKAG